VPALGLSAAIAYLEQIGMERINRYESALTGYAHEVLAHVEGLRLLGPQPPDKAGIVSFVIQGIHAHDVAQIVDQDGIAIRAGHHCAMPLHKRLGIAASNRASFYFYNTRDEVDRLCAALERAQRVFRRRGDRAGALKG
jgi:cysteine desulfurase/selenocysteine lyase